MPPCLPLQANLLQPQPWPSARFALMSMPVCMHLQASLLLPVILLPAWSASMSSTRWRPPAAAALREGPAPTTRPSLPRT